MKPDDIFKRETSSKCYKIRRGQATGQLYVVDTKEDRYVLVTPITDIEDVIKKMMGEDVVDVNTYTCTDLDCVTFEQEKIRELETENARLKIENRRLADRNTVLVSGTRAADCLVWGTSPWSPIREMVRLACCDVREMQMWVSEIKLFQHRLGDNYERLLAHAEHKVRERKEIVRRLFQTRHFKTPTRQNIRKDG